MFKPHQGCEIFSYALFLRYDFPFTKIMYYLPYTEMSFLATLASVSFFKRSGPYNLYCFGRVGYKNDVKTAQNMGTHVFLCKHLIV